MSDTTMPDFGLGFSREEAQSEFPLLPEADVILNIYESKIDDNKKKTGKNWVITTKINENDPLYEEFSKNQIRTWIALGNEDTRWKIVEVYEAITKDEWPEGGMSSEEFIEFVRGCPGSTVRGIVIQKPHYEEDKAAAGQKQNVIKTFNPYNGSDANWTGSKIL